MNSAGLTLRVVASICILLTLQPMAVADESVSERTQEDYELMQVFVETWQQIDRNYVHDVDRRELMEAAIRGMLQHLDPYSAYIPQRDVARFDQVVEQEFGGIGIQVNVQAGQLVVVAPLPGSPAWRAGIRSGDAIIEANGESTEGFSIADAVRVLQGPVGRPVKLGIRHMGSEDVEQLEMLREIIQVPTILGDTCNEQAEWEFMLEPEQGIGYIRISHFSRHTADELKRELDRLVQRDLRGLIIDLRSNPGGLLESAIEISDMFLDSGTIVSVEGRNVSRQTWEARSPDTYPPVPLVVLVNRFSASASEVLSAALQDHSRAVIVGERTWGKGSVQNVIRMESGQSALKLTTATYFRPSGVNIHRLSTSKPDDAWGVTPDEGYDVRMTPDEWSKWIHERQQKDTPAAEHAAGSHDPQLERALACLHDTLSAAPPAESAAAEPVATTPSE